MESLSQSPTDPVFVQNPYPFYDRARATGSLFHWADYDRIPAVSAAAATRDHQAAVAEVELTPDLLELAGRAPAHDVTAVAHLLGDRGRVAGQ